MLYLPEYERLLIGASGLEGYLYGLELKARTWLPRLRVEGETTIWNLVRGGDGLVYGSNYPGSILYCYDPEAHTLTSEGQVVCYPENMYSRLVHALPDGNLLISAGLKEWETHVFDVKTLHFRQVFEPGDYAEKVTDDLVLTTGKNGYRFYDVQPLNLWCRI